MGKRNEETRPTQEVVKREENKMKREKTRTKRREQKKWVSTAAADKSGQISYRTLSSPLVSTLLPLLPPLLSSPVRRQNPYHQGNPLISAANPLNHSETHKNPVISLVAGQLPYLNHTS